MRPAEFTQEQIVAAGHALRDAGRNVTGFALRQRVGGGTPNRLKQVWDEFLASQSTARAQPVAELPVEIAEEMAAVTRAPSERIAALAIELNDKAVKAAERRTGSDSASPLHESGEHLALLPQLNVTTSNPASSLRRGTTTFVSKDDSGEKLVLPLPSASLYSRS